MNPSQRIRTHVVRHSRIRAPFEFEQIINDKKGGREMGLEKPLLELNIFLISGFINQSELTVSSNLNRHLSRQSLVPLFWVVGVSIGSILRYLTRHQQVPAHVNLHGGASWLLGSIVSE